MYYTPRPHQAEGRQDKRQKRTYLIYRASRALAQPRTNLFPIKTLARTMAMKEVLKLPVAVIVANTMTRLSISLSTLRVYSRAHVPPWLGSFRLRPIPWVTGRDSGDSVKIEGPKRKFQIWVSGGERGVSALSGLADV